jgi:CubicO group peptidase (beta-lactamase class C family)
MSYLLLVAALMTTPAPDSVPARWAPLAEYLEASVARHAFPGAVVAVGRRDGLLFLHAVGRLDYERGAAVTARTEYDLASLTKVVGLTTAAMMLVDEGKLDLDAPVTRYVPAFAAGGDSVTVRHLLTHSSGLPAWRPFFQRVHSRAEMFALVNAAPLEAAPGARMAYSDLGAMLLTEVVEHLTGKRLDRFLEARLFGPLGMKDTRYLPPRSRLARLAPTELDTTWRHRLVRGEVHDENAASMGGVSGHAGLFSTAPDLARFVQFLLRGGRTDAPTHRRTETAGAGAQGHGGTLLVRPETVALFTRVDRPGFSSRALGWDTPSENSSAGSHLSARAFGHTGFTGTSVWVDPEQDLFVILLTNRVYPTRNNDLIREVRRQVADLVVAAAR